MANVIDSLVVSLALDAKQFSSGLKKTTDELNKFRGENEKNIKTLTETNKKGFDNLEKSFGKLPASITRATVAVGSFMLAMSGVRSVKNFVSGILEVDSRIEILSKNLRQNASDIDAWGRATELAGGSSSELQQTFQMLSRSQTEMRVTGNTGILQYMRALGVDMVDVNRNARPVNNMLVDMAKSVDRLHLNRADSYNIFKMMGIDEGTATALSGGMKTYNEYMKAAKENGVITDKQAEASRKLEMQFTSTKQRLSTLAREFIVSASPSIEKLFNMFSKWITELANNPQAVEKFFGRITNLVDSLTNALDRLFGKMGSAPTNTQPTSQVTSDFNPNNKPTVAGKVGRFFRNMGDMIGWGESGGNYEAYNSGTIGGVVQHSGVKKGLTGMTLDQILASSKLSASDPNRIFAAGKYQMTSPFIQDAMKKMNITGGSTFTRELQDQMFERMLPPAVVNYLNSKNEGGLLAAQTSLAQMYRSVADPRTGKTYADAGAMANNATVSASSLGDMLRQTKTDMSTGASSLSTNNTTTSIGQVTIVSDHVDANSIKNLSGTIQYNNTTSMQATGGMR